MDIRICCAGEMIMHNMLDVRDIETAGCDVGCYKDCFGGGFESFEGLETLFLHALGVQSVGFEVEDVKEGDETADCVDGVYKDERTAWVAKEEVVEEEILKGIVRCLGKGRG
jgi:hypothetical protein